MSKASRLAGKVHKWLALLMAVQILFWFVSGLFFAIAPIETVRSEHRIAERPARPIPLQAAANGLERIAATGAAAGEKIEVRTMLDRSVVVVTPRAGRPALYDLETGRVLSPIPAALAAEVAERDYAGSASADGVQLVTEASTEYRGTLPAWRVEFDDQANRALYVAADTGAVTARRSDLWRTFDFLWSLHIMDFKNHEDFNTPLLIIATSLGLIVVLSGFIMFPTRLGLTGWRRRKRARRDM